jgi:hypothetical protein
MLRKHVDTLVMELRKKDALELVYKAEDHARELSKKAQGLQRYVCVPVVRRVCARELQHMYLCLCISKCLIITNIRP